MVCHAVPAAKPRGGGSADSLLCPGAYLTQYDEGAEARQKDSGEGFSSPHQTGQRGLGSLQVTENELLERKRLKTEEKPEEAEHLGKEQEHGGTALVIG